MDGHISKSETFAETWAEPQATALPQAELDKLTLKNTRLNGGYKRVKIRRTSHVVVGDPPVAPSDSFLKCNGRRRKWSDFGTACESTVSAWKSFVSTWVSENKANPKFDGGKQVHWDSHIQIDCYSSGDPITVLKSSGRGEIGPGCRGGQVHQRLGVLRSRPTDDAMDLAASIPVPEKETVEVRRVKYVAKDKRKSLH
jgi:hypothetical protein